VGCHGRGCSGVPNWNSRAYPLKNGTATPAMVTIDRLNDAQQRSVVLTPALSILRQHLKKSLQSCNPHSHPLPPLVAGRNPGSFSSSWIAVASESESILKNSLVAGPTSANRDDPRHKTQRIPRAAPARRRLLFACSGRPNLSRLPPFRSIVSAIPGCVPARVHSVAKRFPAIFEEQGTRHGNSGSARNLIRRR
jgi:hypothetical protein